MGINKFTGTQCDFAFVEYLQKNSAENAKKTLFGAILDGKEIRVDRDIGFEEGRQFGRGKNGYQRIDEMRKKFDPDRPMDKANNYNNRTNNRNFRENNRQNNGHFRDNNRQENGHFKDNNRQNRGNFRNNNSKGYKYNNKDGEKNRSRSRRRSRNQEN